MRRYRLIDLSIFALLLLALEFASYRALGANPGEVYHFSVVLPITLLIMIRWDWFGLIHAALGGAFYCILYGDTAAHYFIYIAGNLFIGLSLLWARRVGIKKVRESVTYCVLYCISGYLAMCLGRSTVSLIAKQGFPAVRFLAVEALGAVVAVIVILIARRQKGMFEPQKEYLVRVSKEEEERKHGV
ncbi:MAG: hypothetical protein LBR85_00285 [Oscillospiraceae bacterium]|jgi:hypothetical protein|nr:hypothetical protein [Oscillospiraceae bacterium]